MFGFEFLEMLDLIGMTAQARPGNLFSQHYLQGGVRIFVASRTVFQIVMGFALMTLTALGDIVL